MIGITNSRSEFSTRDVESLEMAKVRPYFGKLINLGYSKSQISSVTKELSSYAPGLYPHLLGAVLYSVLTKLYQQIDVSEIKQGLESIIKKFESPESSRLLYDILDDIPRVLDFILSKILKWEFYYSTKTYGYFEYEYLFVELDLKELRGYRYSILPPSRALEVFLKYLTKKYSSDKAIIKSIEDYLRKKIKELKEYERENLPKLSDESVKRLIEIYKKLEAKIKDYLTYIGDIEKRAKKSLYYLESMYNERHLSNDYYYELYMINKKFHYATEMRNYIEGILKMSYLIEINKVPIDKIMDLLNRPKDPLLNLKETYDLLLSEQEKLFDCEIMKRDWCNGR